MVAETHSQLANFIWSICNLLRGPYKRNEYRKVILPLTVLRRFDCLLAPTKERVRAEHAKIKAKPETVVRSVLEKITGRPFYNLSKFTMERLLDDPNDLAPNLNAYINGFSPNVRAIMERFAFGQQIARMAEKNLLYEVIKAFCKSCRLLVQLDERDLSDQSLERLRYLHAQQDLPIEVIRKNAGLSPERQVDLAKEIASNLAKYYPLLSWRGFPSSDQLFGTCCLIFDYLMARTGKDGVYSGKQLWFKMSRFARIKTIDGLIRAELTDSGKVREPSDAIEDVLAFLRRWGEYHFPRYLTALDNIQRSVFERAGHKPGNYEPYGAAVKQLFMPLSATVLEEYGLPYQLTMRIEKQNPLGDNVDSILDNLSRIEASALDLTAFEHEMLKDAVGNL